ncbi:MAG TPA: alpha/beta hydrolase-fold protein [Bacteroidota bacterium]|nr:alpha/beta hydrolase-fold protein [Bacteroidota bacterium]
MITALMYSLLIASGMMSGQTGPDSTVTNTDGTIFTYRDFPSRYIEPLTVEVWVPTQYGKSDTGRYAVLYMHDGQNLFDPKLSTMGMAWEIDKTAARLMREGKIRNTIIVGVRSPRRREREYQPQGAYEMFDDSLRASFDRQYGGPPLSDGYLRFLVEEVKPFVDAHYRTMADRGNTFIMGSSRGGLISLYALERYPQVFSGAGCLSTHWPIHTHVNIRRFGETMVRYFAAHLPDPRTVRIYFDFGTETLDAVYEPYQTMMDSVMAARGFGRGTDWMTKKFPGDGHSEKFWSKRVDIPLEFLLRP